MTSPEVIFTICRRTTFLPYHILKSLIFFDETNDLVGWSGAHVDQHVLRVCGHDLDFGSRGELLGIVKVQGLTTELVVPLQDDEVGLPVAGRVDPV